MAYSTIDLENLRKFATQRQNEFIDEIQLCDGDISKAEKKLKVSSGLIYRAIRGLKAKSVLSGEIPELGIVCDIPNPLSIKGLSIYNKETPQSPAHWLKLNVKQEQYKQSIIEAVQEAAENPYPVRDVKYKEHLIYDIVPFIHIGDGHLNMIAHESITGQKFDIEICERELCEVISLAVDQMPYCEKIVLHDCSDFTHFENFKAMTEASGHQMDFDKPFPNMIAIYTKLMRFMVETCLQKCQKIDIVIPQGNHSRTNDIWIVFWLREAFKDNPNVVILDNSNILIPYRIGKTFVLFHHGDKLSDDVALEVMACDFPDDWAASKFRYIAKGHVHHSGKKIVTGKEKRGAKAESYSTLAAKDAYAYMGGWRSQQCLTIVYRSRTYGEKGRLEIPIEEVWDSLVKKLGEDNVYIPPPMRAHLG